jgi:hypothetical protein
MESVVYEGLSVPWLCEASPTQLATYLRDTVLLHTTAASLTEQLLDLARLDAVPPSVYACWILACPDWSAITAGLRQSHSVFCRSAALKRFQRRFCSQQFTQLWDALGSTAGIVALLSDWSVDEWASFAKRCTGLEQRLSGGRRDSF